MPVILVKLIMVCSGSGVPLLRRWCPGDEAGQGVQVDGGVAEPVAGAQPGEGVDPPRTAGRRVSPELGKSQKVTLNPGDHTTGTADYSRLLGCETLRLGRLRMTLFCVA
jgi:hypothetical protein